MSIDGELNTMRWRGNRRVANHQTNVNSIKRLNTRKGELMQTQTKKVSFLADTKIDVEQISTKQNMSRICFSFLLFCLFFELLTWQWQSWAKIKERTRHGINNGKVWFILEGFLFCTLNKGNLFVSAFQTIAKLLVGVWKTTCNSPNTNGS